MRQLGSTPEPIAMVDNRSESLTSAEADVGELAPETTEERAKFSANRRSWESQERQAWKVKGTEDRPLSRRAHCLPTIRDSTRFHNLAPTNTAKWNLLGNVKSGITGLVIYNTEIVQIC